MNAVQARTWGGASSSPRTGGAKGTAVAESGGLPRPATRTASVSQCFTFSWQPDGDVFGESALHGAPDRCCVEPQKKASQAERGRGAVAASEVNAFAAGRDVLVWLRAMLTGALCDLQWRPWERALSVCARFSAADTLLGKLSLGERRQGWPRT